MVFKPGWKKNIKETKVNETKKEEVLMQPSSPIYKAFYIEKEKGVWRFIIADLQDDKIIKKQVKECENKALALETFKIKFAETYYFGK